MGFFPLAVVLGLLGLLYSKPAPSAPAGPPSSTKANPGEAWTLRFHLEDPNHTISDATKQDMIQTLADAINKSGVGIVPEKGAVWIDDSTVAILIKYLKETPLAPGTSFTDPAGRSLTLTYAVQSPVNV